MAKWSKDKIIQDLRELKEELGRSPKAKDNSSLTAAAFHYFGSFNKAKKEAGLKIGKKKYTDKEILQALKERPNLTADEWIEKQLKPSVTTIQNQFGSWNMARAEAGLEMRYTPLYDTEDIDMDEKKKRVREALEEGDRWTLREYPKAYLEVQNGWAKKKFNEIKNSEDYIK